MEKYVRARQATDDNIIRRMRFSCWITKATHTHAHTLTHTHTVQCVTFIAFVWQQWLTRTRLSVNAYTLTCYCSDRVSSCNIYAVQQDTQSFLMIEFYSSHVLARHVSDLTGPSSGAFFPYNFVTTGRVE